jgi:hypothetical protein
MKSEQSESLPVVAERLFPGLYYEPKENIFVLAEDEENSVVIHSNNVSWSVAEQWGIVTSGAVYLPPTTKITFSN